MIGHIAIGIIVGWLGYKGLHRLVAIADRTAKLTQALERLQAENDELAQYCEWWSEILEFDPVVRNVFKANPDSDDQQP